MLKWMRGRRIKLYYSLALQNATIEDQFVELSKEVNLYVMNGFLKRPRRRLYTWRSPAGEPGNIRRNRINYISINKRYLN